jgi:hypothetical protein
MCSSPATGAIADQLAALATPAPEPDDDPTFLHELPVITAADLTVVPEDLLRDLYENFNLEVRYHPPEHTVTIRVAVREDRLPAMHAALGHATSPAEAATSPNHPERRHSFQARRTDVLGTPNGIRTRAATLKGWCPRPLDDGGSSPSERGPR